MCSKVLTSQFILTPSSYTMLERKEVGYGDVTVCEKAFATEPVQP